MRDLPIKDNLLIALDPDKTFEPANKILERLDLLFLGDMRLPIFDSLRLNLLVDCYWSPNLTLLVLLGYSC